MLFAAEQKNTEQDTVSTKSVSLKATATTNDNKSHLPSLLLCTSCLKADRRSLRSPAQAVLNTPSGLAAPILATLCPALPEILRGSSVLEHQTDPAAQNTGKTHHHLPPRFLPPPVRRELSPQHFMRATLASI